MDLFNKSKNIFITGGAGFIGSHISDILVKQNLHVMVFDNLSSGKKIFLKKCFEKDNFIFIQGDLLDKNSITNALSPNIDIVFHLASNPDISKGFKEPNLDFQQTILATFHLLQAMKEKQITKLVYFSGSGVYGNNETAITNENYGPLFPISMYGASKLSAEGLISAFAHLYGIQAWIFRPANIIGDRATHGVIFDFINKLRKNPKELSILGNGLQSKSYVYISDLVNGVFTAIEKSNELVNVFNIGTQSFITVNEIADLVIKEMKLENVNISHTPGNVGWPGDIAIVRIDSTKLKKLGWKEEFTSEEAVKKTISAVLLEK